MKRRSTARKPLAVATAALIALALAGIPSARADVPRIPAPEQQSPRQEPLHWGESTTGQGSKIIFRYRPDGTASSPGQLVGGAQVESMTRPAPLGDAHALRLDGRTGAFAATDPIETRGDVGATIEVWFRAASAGNGTLFSNLTADGGVELAYHDGRVEATFVTKKGESPVVQHSIRSTSPVGDRTGWHVAALTIDVTQGATARSRLYLDNEQVTTTDCGDDDQTADGSCQLAVSSDLSLQNSEVAPHVGAKPSASGPVADSTFGGQINAVQVANWPVDHDTLSTPAPRDGGPYFGKPAFFDHTPGAEESDGTAAAKWSDRTWNLARREAWSDRGHPGTDTPEQTDAITAGMGKVTRRMGIGLLNDHYVPQGVAISADGRVMSTISYYADDTGANPVDGACGSKPCPNMITRTDLTTRDTLGVYLLEDQSGEPFGRQGASYHANGLVEADGNLYAALATRRNPDNHVVEGAVHRFALSDAQVTAPANPDLGTPAVYTLTADAAYPVASSGGSMTYAPETRTLYLMGNYQPESMATETDPDGDRPTDGDILGYRLDIDGDIAHPSLTSADETFPLPRTDLLAYNQGLAWVGSHDDVQCFILSRSGLYDHVDHSDPPQPSDWHLQPILEWTGQLTRWCGNATTGDTDLTVQAVLPVGLENTALGPDGTLWSLTENGSYYYQRRTNHQEWYPYQTPYVMGIPITRLGG